MIIGEATNMAAVAKKPPEEEIDPEHPQYAHGMEAGLTAAASQSPAGTLGNLPRVAPTPAVTQPLSGGDVTGGAQLSQLKDGAAPVAGIINRRTSSNPGDIGGAIGNLPRTSTVLGPTPAVGGTQAVIPPKIDLPRTRKRNQSAVTQPNPADFFKQQS